MPRGRPSNFISMTFGRLTVVALSNKNPKSGRYWLCRCACGNPENKEVRGDNLQSGKVASCGCLLTEVREGRLPGRRVGRPAAEAVAQQRAEDPLYRAMNDF